jgi:hypothetical protein
VVLAVLAFGAPPASAQSQAQTTDDGPSWLPVYVGLIGLGVGLLIVLVRRGQQRVGRWVGPLGRAATSSGRVARSLAPLMLVPVEAVSTVAKWRPSRPEAVGRLVREETAFAEPEETAVAEPEEVTVAEPEETAVAEPEKVAEAEPEEAAVAEPEEPAVAEPQEKPPPPGERVIASPAQDGPPAHVPGLDAALVARASPSHSPPPAPAAPEPLPAEPMEESQPRTLRFAVPPATTWERCEIEWWRGYIKSDFYAVAFRPTGEWYVAERSPSFRWRHTEAPREGAAGREEHANLVGRLVKDGWQPVGNGPVWYQTRFRRPVQPSLDELAGTLGSQGTGAES